MPTTAYYTNIPGQLGGPLSIRRGGQSRFVLPDMQGNVRQLTDASGAVTDTLTTDAFGVQKASSGGTVNPFKAYGQWGYFTDTPSRLYVRARVLRVDLGRWVSWDPMLSESNLYKYGNNNPVVLADPSGLWVKVGTVTCDPPAAGVIPKVEFKLCGKKYTWTNVPKVFCNIDITNPACPIYQLGFTGSLPNVRYKIDQKEECDCGDGRKEHYRCKFNVSSKNREGFPWTHCGARAAIIKDHCTVLIKVIDAGPSQDAASNAIADLHPTAAMALWRCLHPNKKWPGCTTNKRKGQSGFEVQGATIIGEE